MIALRTLTVFAALGSLAVPAFAQSTPPPLPKRAHYKYVCQGLKVPVTYDNVKGQAHVQYGDRKYALTRVISADGGRYMNGVLEWWEKGDRATLSSVTNGEADTLLTTCKATK